MLTYFIELIQNWLKNPSLTNYIIAVQIPIVLCLFIQCRQIYKFNLGLSEFKLIYIGWGINLLYLFISILIRRFNLSDELRLSIRTFLDLSTICFFLIGVKKSFRRRPFSYLSKIPTYVIILIAFFAGSVKILPIPLHIVNYIHLRYIPAALFDFSALFLLATYFKNLESKFRQPKILSTITFLYSSIQFLSVAQIAKNEPNLLLLNIDNFGFAVGLILKTLIVISLSFLMINILKKLVIESKELLLKDFSKATHKILDIKPSLEVNYLSRQNNILEITLKKMLELLKKQQGFYSSYNDDEKSLQIKFASKNYSRKIGYQYSIFRDLSGKAIIEQKIQLIKNAKEYTAYKNIELVEYSKEVNSAIAIPILIDSKPLGVFLVECNSENCFSDLDISIVDSLIYQATIGIKNSELINDLETSKRFLDSLTQIDINSLRKRKDFMTLLSNILENALNISKCKEGSIDVLVGDHLSCVASTKRSEIHTNQNINECLSGILIKKKLSILYIEDIEKQSEEYKKLFTERFIKGYKCILAIPLTVNNEVIGIFKIESKETSKFSSIDISKIKGFAGQAAITIYITNLIQDIQQKNKKLEHAIDKRNIEMTSLLSNLINHKIGNEIGLIRSTLNDDFLSGRYGKFSTQIENELKSMFESADSVIKARDKMYEAIIELLVSGLQNVDFIEIKSQIEKNENFKVNKNIRVKILGLEDLKPITVSSYLFVEVISELMSNAIKALPDGGEIIIKGMVKDNWNQIFVDDNGCGISSSNLKHIFENGFSYWGKADKGGGIGLFEVKRIINFWGGTIDVESNVGTGTTFKIKLPYTEHKLDSFFYERQNFSN